jgi:hypothetical protein
MDRPDDGQNFQARIVKLIEDHVAQLDNNKDRIKDLVSLHNDICEEVITYNQLLGYLANDSKSETLWKFKRFTLHQGPFFPSHADYNNPTFNLMV